MMESTTVLFQLEGLPFSVNKKDIQSFFRDSSLIEDDISILKNTENDRCLGLAFVRFHTELEANVATRHCGIEIGGNRVTVKRTSFQDMVTTKQRMESADSHSTRRKISEPISVSPDRTGPGLRSPTGPSHLRSEERGKAIHRLPFQQIEAVASVRESVEKKRNRSRSPHRTRAGGITPSYQSRGSPHGSHGSGAHHEQSSHRHEKVVRHQYGRDGLWREGLREAAGQQQRSDPRSNHMELMTWSSSSSRGSGRSEAASERESRTREEPRRVDVTGLSSHSSSVYRAHQFGSSDGVDHLHYSGNRIHELEERKGHYGKRSHEVELLHGLSRDRTLGKEDHRGYSGGRYREVEIRGGHSGSRNREMEVRARHLGSSNREVEVRGGFSRSGNREVDDRGGYSGSRNREVGARGGHSGSRNREVEFQSGLLGSRSREVEVRGGPLGSRNRDVEVRDRHSGSKNRGEQDYRGHWGGHDGEGSRSGHLRDLRERGSAVGYQNSLGPSQERSALQDTNSATLDTPTTHEVKLMGFPHWYAFKEIRHMLGRSVTVVHGGIHFVADARRPTAFVTVDGDHSYENALKLDGLAIDKQCTLTVLSCNHPRPDERRNEGDDLRRVLEKKREPKYPNSHDSANKGGAYASKRSSSPLPHRRLSREAASRERSYSPGRVQKLADEFWATGSHTNQHTGYPTTQTEDRVETQSYPIQWQDENGHLVPDLPGFHTTEMGQSLAHADFQSQVESGFMEAAMEYPEYFTREELAYTGEHTQRLRYNTPFSQPELSEDFTVGSMSQDNVFRVSTSEGEDIAHRRIVPIVRGQGASPAPDGTLASVVHVVHKGKDGSISMPSEYSHSDGPSSGRGVVTGADRPTTVRCANLPTSVVVTDILSFFQDDTMNHDSVRIQCDDKGQPTGKCFVTFPSYQRAVHVVRRLSNQRLKDKKIILDLVL